MVSPNDFQFNHSAKFIIEVYHHIHKFTTLYTGQQDVGEASVALPVLLTGVETGVSSRNCCSCDRRLVKSFLR